MRVVLMYIDRIICACIHRDGRTMAHTHRMGTYAAQQRSPNLTRAMHACSRYCTYISLVQSTYQPHATHSTGGRPPRRAVIFLVGLVPRALLIQQCPVPRPQPASLVAPLGHAATATAPTTTTPTTALPVRAAPGTPPLMPVALSVFRPRPRGRSSSR